MTRYHLKQKTLNRMGKYCKAFDLRFGQLLVILSNRITGDSDAFYIEDKPLELEFNKLWLEQPPVKNRGGYYPKGH